MNCNHMEEISIGIGTAVRERFHKMSLVSKLCLVQFKLCFPPKGGSTRIIAFGVLLIAFNVEESLRAYKLQKARNSAQRSILCGRCVW